RSAGTASAHGASGASAAHDRKTISSASLGLASCSTLSRLSRPLPRITSGFVPRYLRSGHINQVLRNLSIFSRRRAGLANAARDSYEELREMATRGAADAG